MSKPAFLAEPVLVGREKELAELQTFLNSAIEGEGKTVFVSGEAGSGKTRLTREFLNSAIKQGVAVMAGWCLSDAQVPYFPFMEAFNNYYSASNEEETQSNLLSSQAQLGLGTPVRVGIEDGGREITSWLAGQKPAGKAGMLSPQAWKDQVFATVSEILHAVAYQVPVVLFIEDAHWADSASLALIHYVSRAIHDSERVLVIATYRSEQLTADAEGHPHPLTETLGLMRREELFTEIRLSSLSQADVSRIAENMIGGKLQSNLAEKLATESRGNPLFVVESLRMLHERRGLIEENNEWHLAVDGFGIPAKIKDIILRRLACLKSTQRRVLDAASVIGEEFDVELLSNVLGQDNLDILETLNLIAHSTSMVLSIGNRYRFDHARSRDILYEELALPLKRGYHNRIAEKLESRGNKSKLPLSELAYHFAQADKRDKAVKYSIAAGQDALARWSNVEAMKHFTYVLQSVGQDGGFAEDRVVAIEGLGDALDASSLFKESMKIFEDLYENTKADAVKLRALRKAMDSAFKQGDARYLLELVKKAEPFADSDRLEHARVLLLRGRALMIQYMFPASLEDSKAALRIFEEEYSLSDAASALVNIGAIYAFMGMPQQALAESLRSIVLCEELGDFHGQMEAYYVGANTFGLSFLAPEGEKMFRKVIEIDERMKMGTHDLVSRANACVARHLEFLGSFEEALPYSLKALELSKKTDSPWTQSFIYSNLTRQYIFLGDLVHAKEYFKKLVEMPPEIRDAPDVWFPRTEVIFYAANNQGEELNRVLEKIKLDAFKFKKTRVEVVIKWTVAWAFERQGRLEEAGILREEAGKIVRDGEARFEHADLQAHLIARCQVVVGEEFEMRFDFVNIGRKPCTIVNIESAVPPEFNALDTESSFSLRNGSLEMKEKIIGPFLVETVKLKLKPTQSGVFTISPGVIWMDDLGNTKTFQINSITITVEQAKPAYEVLAGRVTTGTKELDRLLLGGIPKGSAVALTGPSSDERQRLIQRFLEVGVETGEITLYITCEAGYSANLAQSFQKNFGLVVCNPQTDPTLQNLSNVYKLKGTDNLTDVDIALTKYLRAVDSSGAAPKRACVDLLSDVLLQHHVVVTRKWLSSLLATLKSKGFTFIAVVDPSMHPLEEANAILSLFDGEIEISEEKDAIGRVKSLRVLRLQGQSYLKEEVAFHV